MAEIKVSQLPEASEINDNDLIMIVQNGTNKKITKENCQFASGDEISIGTTEPTGEEKIWIDPTEVPSGIGTDISNVYSDAQDKAYSCHYINNNDTYSTSEIKTNKTWIDGKPIYRKIVSKTSGFSTGEAQINHDISNINEIVHIEGVAYRDGGDWEPVPACPPPNYASQYQISVYDFNSTRFRLFLGSSALATGTKTIKLYIIVEYTKTTD